MEVETKREGRGTSVQTLAGVLAFGETKSLQRRAQVESRTGALGWISIPVFKGNACQ